MAYNPIFDTADAHVVLNGTPDVQSLRQPKQRMLRRGYFSLDRLTGEIAWHGETIRLGREQHHLLTLMLEHAGQILSSEYLASALDIAPLNVKPMVCNLRSTLQEHGVSGWLPREVEGTGFVLWR